MSNTQSQNQQTQQQVQQQSNFQQPQTHQKDKILQSYEDLIFVDNLQSSTFGQIAVYRTHPYVKYLACKTIPQTQINYQERINYKHPNIFYMPQYDTQKNNQVNIYFEYRYPTLNSHVNMRQNKKFIYPEFELWIMARQIIHAMKFLQDKGIWHGDIDSNNVFFDDEYLMFRFYDNNLLNGPYEGYKKFVANTMSYLAPELIQCIQMNEQLHTGYNFYKTDVFSFGLVLLEAGSLISSSTCIDVQQRQLDFVKINQHVHQFAQHYSPVLVSLLQRLLEADYRKRLDWSELLLLMNEETLQQAIKDSYQQNTEWMKEQETIRLQYQNSQFALLTKPVTWETQLPVKSFMTDSFQIWHKSFTMKQQLQLQQQQQVVVQVKENEQQQQSSVPQQQLQLQQIQTVFIEQHQQQQQQQIINLEQKPVVQVPIIKVLPQNEQIIVQPMHQQEQKMKNSMISVLPENNFLQQVTKQLNQAQNILTQNQVVFEQQSLRQQSPQTLNQQQQLQQQQQKQQQQQQILKHNQNQIQPQKVQVNQEQNPQQQQQQVYKQQKSQQQLGLMQGQLQQKQVLQQQYQSQQNPSKSQQQNPLVQQQQQQQEAVVQNPVQQQQYPQKQQIQQSQVEIPKAVVNKQGVLQNKVNVPQQTQQQQQIQTQKQNEQQQSQSQQKQSYVFEGMRNSLSRNILDGNAKKFMSSSHMFERENFHSGGLQKKDTMFQSQFFNYKQQGQGQQENQKQINQVKGITTQQKPNLNKDQEPQQQQQQEVKHLGNSMFIDLKRSNVIPKQTNLQFQQQQQMQSPQTQQQIAKQQQQQPQTQQIQQQQQQQQQSQSAQNGSNNQMKQNQSNLNNNNNNSSKFRSDMNQTLKLLNQKIQETLEQSNKQTKQFNYRQSTSLNPQIQGKFIR